LLAHARPIDDQPRAFDVEIDFRVANFCAHRTPPITPIQAARAGGRHRWCGQPESNRHSPCEPRDFKSLASTNSAMPASLTCIVFLGFPGKCFARIPSMFCKTWRLRSWLVLHALEGADDVHLPLYVTSCSAFPCARWTGS